MGGPGAEGAYGATLLSFISAGQGTDCEAAKCLKGALPVQYFILMGPSGVRGVSVEEQWENLEGTFIPGEKHCVCEREVQREQREDKKGQGYRKMEREIEMGEREGLNVGGRRTYS